MRDLKSYEKGLASNSRYLDFRFRVRGRSFYFYIVDLLISIYVDVVRKTA